MIKQVQSQLKQTQVTPLGVMDQAAPFVPQCAYPQIDDPDVRQTSRDQQAGQALWIGQMAFVEVKATTLLICSIVVF